MRKLYKAWHAANVGFAVYFTTLSILILFPIAIMMGTFPVDSATKIILGFCLIAQIIFNQDIIRAMRSPNTEDTEDFDVGYMCKTDFDYELYNAVGGTAIYPCVTDLKECRPCVEGCGIVKVKVQLIEVTQKELH